MDWGDQVVGLAGDDRAGSEPLAGLRILPRRPQPGQGQGCSVLAVDVVRKLAFVFALPLVEAVGRYQAAALGQALLESRLGGDRLGPGVDVARRHLLVLRPERKQPPPERAEQPAPLVLGHRIDLIGRCHVERSRKRLDGDLVDPEELGVFLRGLRLNEPSAHRAPLSHGGEPHGADHAWVPSPLRLNSCSFKADEA